MATVAVLWLYSGWHSWKKIGIDTLKENKGCSKEDALAKSKSWGELYDC
jgi:hypothetical protein